MSLMVRFGRNKAILRAGQWVCADLDVERRLNLTTSQWIRETGGPGISCSDQEKAVAAEMARRFQGKVLLHIESTSGRSSAYFIQQRQMRFEFTSFVPGNSRRHSR